MQGIRIGLDIIGIERWQVTLHFLGPNELGGVFIGKRTMRICFIGDSFVNGTGDDDCLGWVGRVCSRARRGGADITVYNLGIRRDTSADIRGRWRREAAVRLPAEFNSGLVFSFGANDCVVETPPDTRVSVEASMANTTAILREAKAWLPVLMVGPAPIGDADMIERDRAPVGTDRRGLRFVGGAVSVAVGGAVAVGRLVEGGSRGRRGASQQRRLCDSGATGVGMGAVACLGLPVIGGRMHFRTY